MKGRLSPGKWSVSYIGCTQDYLAERIVNGGLELHEIRSHCLACAKADILSRYGGTVDLRGWHRQGFCGAFLYAMANDRVDTRKL